MAICKTLQIHCQHIYTEMIAMKKQKWEVCQNIKTKSLIKQEETL